MKKYSLSLTDFAQPAPKTGSIDLYAGFNQGQNVGLELHKSIQAKRAKTFLSYQSEVSIKHEFTYKKYVFTVRGRMDGIYNSNRYTIEEIKTAFNLNKLFTFIQNEIEHHPYCLQLKTYGYIHWIKTGEIPALNLHLVSSRNQKFIDVPLKLDINHYEAWLTRRFNSLVEEITISEKRIKQRKKIAKGFTFPFTQARSGQKELIESVSQGLKNNHHMLIQAPTGLGKTMGILFPTLQNALQRGQKSIYLTPKNSQHTVVQDAIKKLQKSHKLKSMTLTAKSKLCFKSQTICNSEFCEYAKNYYTKLTENKIIDELKKIKNTTAESVKKLGAKYEVCPYELQMDNIANVDTIICDYNYAFSPQYATNRIAKLNLGETEKPNLIIDEFHNLPERAMSYYSPILSSIYIKDILSAIKKVDKKFRNTFQTILANSISLINSVALPHIDTPHKISPPIKLFKESEVKIKEFISAYLESDVDILQDDLVLTFNNYWMEFTAALEYVELNGGEFFTSYHPKDHAIKITCCDASTFLIGSYTNYKQVVGFSATLKPFNFYSQLTGLNTNQLKTFEFLSPFPTQQRKIIVIPQVSSKYSERTRNYPKVTEVINKITALREGNYIVFFPSFDFLTNVLKIYTPIDNIKLITQQRNMKQYDVDKILLQLKNPSMHHLLFAVQGGIFSEGIDYPGNMIIGVFIIGPPLPLFDWEREQMRKYYDENYNAGFDYAYIYPAMAKSIQASGRVIRSETDKGIIILMDNRFLLENYAKCMPEDWYVKNPQEMVSTRILHDVETFWLK